jgi:hypothetical protein
MTLFILNISNFMHLLRDFRLPPRCNEIYALLGFRATYRQFDTKVSGQPTYTLRKVPEERRSLCICC